MSGPLLDLRAARRIWVGPTEATELWIGGSHWARPAPAPAGVAAYYGTDPGQIPMDLRFDDPTLSGAAVSSVRNDGGAGAYFTATPSVVGLMVKEGNATRFSAASPWQLNLATGAQLLGVHFTAAIRLPVSPVTAYPRLFYGSGGAGAGCDAYFDHSKGSLGLKRMGVGGATVVTGNIGLVKDQWQILGVRYANGRVGVRVNGRVVYDQPGGTDTATATMLGSINGTYIFDGLMARVVSVVTTTAATVSSPEPAVIAAEQLMAQLCGVALG